MSLSINAVEKCTNVPECMVAEEIRQARQDDDHLSALLTYLIHHNTSTAINKSRGQNELHQY